MSVVRFNKADESSRIGGSKVMPQLHLVTVSQLKTFPQTRGVAFEDLDVADLIPSVEAHGVEQPLTVCGIKGEPDCYGVICGHRRLKAAQKTGQSHVPVLIRRNLFFGQKACREPIQRLQIEENLHHQRLTPIQEALAIQGYLQEHQLSEKETARNLGLPRTNVRECLKIARLVSEGGGGGRPSPLDPHEQNSRDNLEGLSKSLLLLLAEHREAPIFPKLLARCRQGHSVRALQRYASAGGRQTKNKKPKPFLTVRRLTATLWDGQARVTAKVEAADAFLRSDAPLDPKCLQRNESSIREWLDVLKHAIAAIAPNASMGSTDHNANQAEADLPAPTVIEPWDTDGPSEGDLAAATPSANRPRKKPMKPSRPPGEASAGSYVAELMARADPPSEAARRYWAEVLDNLRKPPMSDWEYQVYLKSSEAVGEIGDTVLVALGGRTSCMWARKVCGDLLAELTQGKRPIELIDRAEIPNG